MALITYTSVFKNTEEFAYATINENYLSVAVYEFARLSSQEMYKTIMNEKVSLRLNGKIIHPDDWYMEIQEEDKIVITPIFSGKNIGGFITTVMGAVLVVLDLTIFHTGYLTAMGVSMMLGGISSILFAPNLPLLSTNDSQDTQTYNWSGIKTIAKTDVPIPIVYGTHKVGGNVISLFTESYDNNSYLNILLSLCEGEIEGICQEHDHSLVCSTSYSESANYASPAIEINEQPLRVFDEVEWWYRTGTNTKDPSKNVYDPTAQNKIPNLSCALIQYDVGKEINTTGIEYVTTKEVDKARIQIFIPQLYDATDNGGIQDRTVSYKIECKKDGDSYSDIELKKWTPSVTSILPVNSSGWLRNLYCTKYYNDSSFTLGVKPATYKIKIIEAERVVIGDWETLEYRTKIAITNSDDTIVEEKVFSQIESFSGFDADNVSDSSLPVRASFTIDSYYIQLGLNVVTGDVYQVESTEVIGDNEVFVTEQTKTGFWSSVLLDFTNDLNGKGIYTVKISRTDGGVSTSLQIANTMILKSVVEFVEGSFIYPNTALLGFRMKATGQLSGSPPNITTIIKGKKVAVPDIVYSGSDVAFDSCYWNSASSNWKDEDDNTLSWDDTSVWRDSTAEKEYSNNAILCVRDLMFNSRYGLGKFINTDDIYNTNIVTAVKECHKSYNPFSASADLFGWWDDTNYADWIDEWWAVKQSTIGTTVTDRTVVIDSTETDQNLLYFYCSTTTNLSCGQKYSLTITLSGNTDTIYTIEAHSGSYKSKVKQDESLPILDTINTPSVGTHTINFTAPKSTTNTILFIFIGNNDSNKQFDFTITNVSLTTSSYSAHYHTWNGVLESPQSALTVLTEICDAFRCWPIWFNERFNFVLDTDDTPIHTLAISNTTEFNQSFTPLSEIPYKLEGQFIDAGLDYNMRSITAVSSDSTLNKLNKRTIGLKGITNRQKAERETIWKLNKVTNGTHNINVKSGLNMIHGTAGDIINVQNDLPSFGTGGRLLDYNSLTKVLTLDNKYTFDDVNATYIARYQTDENEFLNATVVATSNVSQAVTLVTWPTSNPCEDAVYTIGKQNDEVKKFRLVSARRTEDGDVECAAIEHISSLYDGEPTITIVGDEHRTRSLIKAKPDPITFVSVQQTEVWEGLGFVFGIDLPENSTNVCEVIVSMSNNDSSFFKPILTIPAGNKQGRFIDNNLPLGSYTFRFVCRTEAGVLSSPLDVGGTLRAVDYMPQPPSGYHIKNQSPNIQTFDGRDVVLQWDRVGTSYNTAMSLRGYKVEVFHDSPETVNLKRTTNTNTEEYVYSLEDNIDDSETSTPSNSLFFRIYTVSVTNAESESSIPYNCSNTTPVNPSGLTAIAKVDEVLFEWTKNSETDLKNYLYKIQVESEGWSSWIPIETNNVSRKLTNSELITQGVGTSNVQIEVKAIDWYENESSISSANADATSKIADNVAETVTKKWAGETGANVTASHTAADAAVYTGAAIATTFTDAKCTDANADQTSSNTASDAAAYTGAAIATTYTAAKCTDANADQTSVNTALNSARTEGNVTTIQRPGGAAFSGSANSVGIIKITLPQSWSSTMMKFFVDVFEYSTGKSFTLELAGYNRGATNEWRYVTANLTGSTAANNRVRFGHDGIKCCICIGETNSDWSYLKTNVRDFQAGASNYSISQWDDGWSISVLNDLSGITFTADIADSLIDANTILNQGALATENNLDGVPNGTEFSRVNTTAVSAGKIVLTSDGVTGTLPTSLSAAKCTDADADQTSSNTASDAAAYTGAAIATTYTAAKCTDANADQTSSNTASDAAAYTGAAIATTYTAAKCTDANATEGATFGSNISGGGVGNNQVGNDGLIAIITGGIISTGAIQSTNWAAAAGMQIDLDNATITIREPEGLKIASGADILLEHGGDIKFTSVTAPSACTAALAGSGAGNVDDGTHEYKITYVNDAGETELGAVSNVVTVVDKTSNGQVSLTGISVSSSNSVTKRKIYRTKAGGYNYYYVGEIANNTGTIFNDNVADSGLETAIYNYKTNNSYGKIWVDGTVTLEVNKNIFLGYHAGYSNTTGYNNIFTGIHAGGNNTTGYNNIFIGYQAGYHNITGLRNILTGYCAGYSNIDGDNNVFTGYKAGISNTIGSHNVFLGQNAGFSNITGDKNIEIGSYAGYYETASNAFYVNNQDRTNTAGDKAKSLLYGTMAAAVADQTLAINAVTTISVINAATTDTDKFIVSDSGVIKYRTGAQVLSDIGGAGAGANSDITSMTGLNNDGIPLAKVANAASSGGNSDITSLSGLTTPLTKAQGGSGTTGDSIIKGWINFNGTGTIAINDSFNVTSITDNGTGDYTITWDTDFANVNYAISGVTQYNELATMPMIVLIKGSATAQLVGSCRIATQYTVDTNPYDCLQVQVMALGDQ